MEKELKKIILSLAEAIEKENNEEYKEVSDKLLTSLLNSPYNLKNPENYNCIFHFRLTQILENVTKKLHKEQLAEVRDQHKPQFIYLNYNYLSSNIEKLVQKRHGTSAFCADISRTIIIMYLEYSLTGDIPETDYEEHYWLPRFGENKDWINFCDGLYKLYYGNNELYLSSLKVLLECKMKKP